MRAARAVASFRLARLVNILILQCGRAFTRVPQLQNYMTVETTRQRILEPAQDMTVSG